MQYCWHFMARWSLSASRTSKVIFCSEIREHHVAAVNTPSLPRSIYTRTSRGSMVRCRPMSWRCSYHTAPHIDVMATGKRGAAVLRRILVEGAKPVTAFRKMPLVVPVERANTQDPASFSYGVRKVLEGWEPQSVRFELQASPPCNPGSIFPTSAAPPSWCVMAMPGGPGPSRVSASLAREVWEHRARIACPIWWTSRSPSEQPISKPKGSPSSATAPTRRLPAPPATAPRLLSELVASTTGHARHCRMALVGPRSGGRACSSRGIGADMDGVNR